MFIKDSIYLANGAFIAGSRSVSTFKVLRTAVPKLREVVSMSEGNTLFPRDLICHGVGCVAGRER